MSEKENKLTVLSKEATTELLEQLSKIIGVSSKKMFGGYGIFCDGKMFGMISAKGQAFFKVDDSNQSEFEAKGSTRHSRMPYFTIPNDIMENQELLIEWAGKSIEIALKKK